MRVPKITIESESFEKAKLLLNAGVAEEKVVVALRETGVSETEAKRSIKLAQSKAAETVWDEAMTVLCSQFLIYRDDLGTSVVLRKSEGSSTVAESSKESLYEVAAKFLLSHHLRIPRKKIVEFVESWLLVCETISEFPKSFSLSHNTTAFNHVAVDPSIGPTPVFDDFIGRCGPNGRALMAFIWSIFVEDDKVQQYILMRGEGRDGKGSLMRLIERLVGHRAYAGVSMKDPHWVAKLVGKRVAYWGDVNSTTFVLSAEFKSVTGGDKVTITEKYRPSYSAYLNPKIFISTNNDAEVTSRKSDLRRCIFIDIAPNPNVIEDYEGKLWNERHGILFKCREAYQGLLNPKENIITCDLSALLESADDFEVRFGYVFDTCFELSAENVVTREQAYKECAQFFKMPQEYAQFVRWMERKHNIKSVEAVHRESGRRRRMLKGLKMKAP